MAPFYLILTFFLGNLFTVTETARILVLIPVGTKSHTSGFAPLFHSLASRGHQVTVVTNFLPSKSVPNVTYIQNFDLAEVMGNFENPFEMRLAGRSLNHFEITEFYEYMCVRTHATPEVMNLLDQEFDLLIINSFMSECILGFASQFKNAKLMYFSTLQLVSFISSVFGNPVLPSTAPVYVSKFSERMTFTQRLENFVETIHYYYLRHYKHIPRMEAVYRKTFPDAPSVVEVEANVDLILINSHPIVNYPRALLPNMIETAGLQCGPGKTLPEDLQNFIDGSGEDGFIYFSMGSFLQGSELPDNIRLEFLRAFGKLKQRIIWKFETEKMEDLPPNVLLGKWFPQQDILAHPSIRLFVTHGGLLSLQEAVYHAVPLLGIPLFGDQDGNLEQARSRGFSLTLELEDITEEYALGKINRILGDDSFQSRANEVSASFRDRPVSPLETAIFWSEYLLRNNNTKQLHSAGRHLHPIQYHSIDVMATLGFSLLLALYVVFKTVHICWSIFARYFYNTKKTQKGSKKTN